MKKNLGFGCMRLALAGDKVDYDVFNRMIDEFIAAGFNYFDTAHGYLEGKSEIAIRDCLVARYKREDYILANKLSAWYFEKEEDIVPLFESQLKLCGVEYFDFYLLHSLTRESYKKHKACHSFEIVKDLKKQGKIKHIALSFHDTADILDMILSEQPDIEAVQLQINYLDYDDPGVQSKACYDVAIKHGKKVIVMEPVRGGYLVNLPDKAAALFDELNGGSYASYALRYAASYPEVFMVLSGMNNMNVMLDNINTFKDFVPLNEEEYKATDRAREIIREVRQIPCTGCNYCTEVCPKHIPIPELFSAYNKVLSAKITGGEAKESFPKDRSNGSDCIGCKKCEKVCPQSIEIATHIEKVSKL
ncbi:MAG: 4Fe-4S dicluster domain-containing protein [Ruminococcaceae bacterium]|nr:4Fe-4S dicluster domain-containing protein [Oscillospiraceae bacterium]